MASRSSSTRDRVGVARTAGSTKARPVAAKVTPKSGAKAKRAAAVTIVDRVIDLTDAFAEYEATRLELDELQRRHSDARARVVAATRALGIDSIVLR